MNLDAKQHICARRDKSNLESRFINVLKGRSRFPGVTEHRSSLPHELFNDLILSL